MGQVKKALYVALGTGCVGLGVIGILVPLMPTTPFLLLAAFFYSRSSPRFLNWLLNHRYFGSYIRNFREGRGMPLRAKVVTLSLMWLTMGLTAYFLPVWWMRGLLLCVALGVTGYVGFRLKTMPTVELGAGAEAREASADAAGLQETVAETATELPPGNLATEGD